MQDRVTYEFSVIRLMPRVEREEFLNIGVILFSKPLDYLDLCFKIDPEKILNFSSDVDIKVVTEYLEAWKLIASGDKSAGPIGQLETASRFRWLTASKSTIIQCSEVHPGLCYKPQVVLEDIYRRFVL